MPLPAAHNPEPFLRKIYHEVEKVKEGKEQEKIAKTAQILSFLNEKLFRLLRLCGYLYFFP
jgi:hypothetical protein